MLNKNKKVMPLTVMYLMTIPIVLTSCLPEFKEPLPRTAEVKPDTELLGNWTRIAEKSERQQLSIFPRSDNWFDIFYIYHINSVSADGANMIILEGYNTEIQGQKFLCMRFRDKDINCWKQTGDFVFFDKETGEHSYFFALYQINKNGLSIYPLSMEKIKKLINNEILKGDVFEQKKQNGKFQRVFVTSPPDDLVKIFSEQDARTFLAEEKDGPLLFSREIEHSDTFSDKSKD